MSKSVLSPEFIESQRQVLLALQERLSGHRVVQDQDEPNGCDFGDLSAAVTAAENALALVSNGQQTLRDVHAALAKIKDGTYGICEFTGEPIGQERLEAIPWARYSIEAQAAFEKEGGRFNGGFSRRSTGSLFDDSMKAAEEETEEAAEPE